MLAPVGAMALLPLPDAVQAPSVIMMTKVGTSAPPGALPTRSLALSSAASQFVPLDWVPL